MLVATRQTPHAVLGILLAGFMAAFMSTVATQLNWGSSYLIEDFYRRFLKKEGSEAHFVNASRLATAFLVLAAAAVAWQLTSVSAGWKIVLELGAGTGGVYLLRWYWWRINAWSEISAMAVAAAMTIALSRASFSGNTALVYAKTALITGLVTTIAWLIATFVTKPESQQTLVGFYKRVHPTVYGWKHVAKLVPELPEVRDLAGNTFNWVMGCVLVYGCLFGIGKLVFQQWFWGIVLLAIAAVAGYLIFWDLSRRGWATLSGTSVPVATPRIAQAD
jgi:uncharacterized sodium:solute symporter family permease YidK